LHFAIYQFVQILQKTTASGKKNAAFVDVSQHFGGRVFNSQANMINQLVMAALGSKVSPLTQRMFGLGGSLRNSRSDFLADREQGAGQNYLDYVRNRLGLQMFGI